MKTETEIQKVHAYLCNLRSRGIAVDESFIRSLEWVLNMEE